MAHRAAAWKTMRQRESSGSRAKSIVCTVVDICNMTPLQSGPREREIRPRNGSQRHFRPLGNVKLAFGGRKSVENGAQRGWNGQKRYENYEMREKREILGVGWAKMSCNGACRVGPKSQIDAVGRGCIPGGIPVGTARRPSRQGGKNAGAAYNRSGGQKSVKTGRKRYFGAF